MYIHICNIYIYIYIHHDHVTSENVWAAPPAAHPRVTSWTEQHSDGSVLAALVTHIYTLMHTHLSYIYIYM